MLVEDDTAARHALDPKALLNSGDGTPAKGLTTQSLPRSPHEVQGNAVPFASIAISSIDQHIGIERETHRQRW
jgi:hypothetical protein